MTDDRDVPALLRDLTAHTPPTRRREELRPDGWLAITFTTDEPAPVDGGTLLLPPHPVRAQRQATDRMRFAADPAGGSPWLLIDTGDGDGGYLAEAW